MRKGFTLAELLIGLFLLAILVLICGGIVGQANLMNSFECPPGSEETKGYVNGHYVHTCTAVAQ